MMKPSHAAQRHASIAYLALALSVFFLSANHIIGRGVHETVPPVGLSFWRWLVGALLLLPFIAPGLRRSARAYRKALPTFVLLGGLIVASTTVILIALNFTTAINVALINATQPTITVFLSRAFLGQRLSARQGAGIAIALAGVVTTITRGDLQVLISLSFNLGDLLTLVAMFGFSSYAINVYRLPAGLGTAESLFGLIIAGCILLAPFHVVEHLFFRAMPVTGQTVSVVVTLAVFASCLAMLLWNLGNRAVGANIASIFINLIPVFGTTMAIVFLDEQLRWFHLAGMALVGAGIFMVVSYRRPR